MDRQYRRQEGDGGTEACLGCRSCVLQRNDSHGIAPKDPLPFNGFADLPSKIEKVILEEGVKIHLSKRQRRYIVGE